MKRVLITGINSFVGRNICKYSSISGIEEVSLLEKRLEEIPFEEYDVVIHLVAIVHQTRTIPEERYFEINTDLCIATAKQAKLKGVGHFIFMSTAKVYGKFTEGGDPLTEESDCYPDDPYSRSKYAAEEELRKLDCSSFIVSIVRAPLVYGENVRANMLNIIKLIKYAHLLPFKDLHNRRNFTSAENLVAFIDRIIEIETSGVFIAMDEGSISTTELVNMIAANMNKRVLLFKFPHLLIKFGIRFFPTIFERLYGSFELDNRKTLERLNFMPPASIDDGIKKMVKSYMLR